MRDFLLYFLTAPTVGEESGEVFLDFHTAVRRPGFNLGLVEVIRPGVRRDFLASRAYLDTRPNPIRGYRDLTGKSSLRV